MTRVLSFLVDESSWTLRRRGHACGKFEKDGKTVLIVAGGFDGSLQDLDSVEYLIPSSGQGWKLGM